MATELHEGANGNVKKDEVEPLGELKAKEELKKPADPSHGGDLNGCETLAEKEEPLTKVPTPSKQKVIGIEDEGVEEPQDGNDYSSEEEEEGDAEVDEDARDVEGEPDEEDGDEEYVDDGEDDDGDDEESQPPPKRRK